jgi:hypothetical protein
MIAALLVAVGRERGAAIVVTGGLCVRVETCESAAIVASGRWMATSILSL